MSLIDGVEININNEDRNSIFASRNAEINPIVIQLEEFGYDNIYSRRVFFYLHPENLEEALNYMAVENGIIQHRYIQGRYISNNICYICGEERKKHLNELNNENINNYNLNNNRIDVNESNIRQIQNYNFNNNNHLKKSSLNNDVLKVNKLNELEDDFGNFNINNNKENIISNKIFNFKSNKNKIDNKPFIVNNTFANLIPEEEKKECERCNEIFIVNENNKVEKCGHSFCPGCWYDFLSVKIKENKLPSIKCLDYNCQEKLTDEFIINLLNSNTYLIKAYKRYKLELEIINDPNKKLCPYPNCDSFLELIDIRNKDVTCKNNHTFCFECLKKSHGKLPCNETIDKNLVEYAKNNFVKKCPKCSIIIEKNKGCNHITCTKCGYQWCWLCNKEYNANHFNEGKCRGFQFFQPKNDYEIKLMMEGKININELTESQVQHNIDAIHPDIQIIIDDIGRINREINNNHELPIREFEINNNHHHHPFDDQMGCGKKALFIFFYILFGNNFFFLFYFYSSRKEKVILFGFHLYHLITFFFQLIFLNILTVIILIFSRAINHLWNPRAFIEKYFIIILYLLLGNFFLVSKFMNVLLTRIHIPNNKYIKFMIFFSCFIISIIILFPKVILINVIILFNVLLMERDFSMFSDKLDDIFEEAFGYYLV